MNNINACRDHGTYVGDGCPYCERDRYRQALERIIGVGDCQEPDWYVDTAKAALINTVVNTADTSAATGWLG